MRCARSGTGLGTGGAGLLLKAKLNLPPSLTGADEVGVDAIVVVAVAAVVASGAGGRVAGGGGIS